MATVSCVLGTDVAIDYLRLQTYAIDLLGDWAAGGWISVSSLTHFEVYQGIRPGEESNTTVFLEGLLCVPVDAHVAAEAGKISRQLQSYGATIGVADVIIAATALELGVPLITNNAKYFSIPGLTIVHGRTGTYHVRERRRRYAAK